MALNIRTMRAVVSPKLSRGNASTRPIATTCWRKTLHSTPGSKLIEMPSGGSDPSYTTLWSVTYVAWKPWRSCQAASLGRVQPGRPSCGVGVRVIVDHRPRAIAREARHGTGQDQRGDDEQHQRRGTERRSRDHALPAERVTR